MILSEEELIDMYKTNMIMIKEHGFSLEDIENMIPFERQIYIMLLLDFIEKRKQELLRG